MLRRRNLLIFLLLGVALLVGWVGYESWQLATSAPVAGVDHLAAVRARVIARAGVDPDAGTAAWAALIRAFDIHDAVEIEIIARVEADGELPRGSWDTGAAVYNHLLAGSSIPDDAERELDAIELFDEDGGRAALAEFARASTAIGPPPAPARRA